MALPPDLSRRHLSTYFLALGVGGCAAGAGGSGAARTGERVGGVEVGLPVPDLALRGLGNKATSLKGLRGHVVLLDVWASWCAPCKVELPMLDDIAQRVRSKNVVVAAVSVDQEEDNVRRFLNSRKRWNIRFFHDPAGQVAERLAPPKMPTSYLIDKEGVVRMVNAGFEESDAPRIERHLLELASA